MFDCMRSNMPGGLGLALHTADSILRGIDRRRPEARAVAAWLDGHRQRLGLPDGEDFCPGKETYTALPLAAWRRVRATITRLLRANDAATDTPAHRWANILGNRLGLTELDRQVLGLALAYAVDESVEHLVDAISRARGGDNNLSADPALLALLLNQPPDRIDAAVLFSGHLLGCGLLEVGDRGSLRVQSQVARLVRRAAVPGDDPFDHLLGPALPAVLPRAAFSHIGAQAGIAAGLLRTAVRQKEPGINILLYGPPGTGKTSFAATLAAEVGARLRAVTEQDSHGNEANRLERLSGLRLAQRLAPLGETVLLFDEAEDGFASGHGGEAGMPSRVFMHRLLERTPVPVIWTANDIRVLGPAAVRRMTLCVEMKVPSIAARTRLWRELGEKEGVPLPEPEAARLARLVPAAPALAATALRATRLAHGDAGTVQLIVEGTARAVSGHRPTLPDRDHPTTYDPALVHADTDLLALADTLCRPGAPRAMSLLLSGPPGTGKSAWVRHLADRMNLPLLPKRGSDLFGPYVGQTEAAIAAAFAEAREDGAFLLFDEADSLLADRSGATRNWEVSQVNEMLTWMEHHPLPFACTTNLPDRLDPASLRRFLVKVRLDWMTPDQVRAAFRQFFGVAPPRGLDELATLTPADFALVRRRAGLMGMEGDAAAAMRLLAAECEGRIGGRGRMGFAG